MARKDLIDEDSGAWETVAIPVESGTPYRYEYVLFMLGAILK